MWERRNGRELTFSGAPLGTAPGNQWQVSKSRADLVRAAIAIRRITGVGDRKSQRDLGFARIAISSSICRMTFVIPTAGWRMSASRMLAPGAPTDRFAHAAPSVAAPCGRPVDLAQLG